MPSTIDIRRRIRSVKNTQQITKAMKMVAAAKLRRAQERMFARAVRRGASQGPGLGGHARRHQCASSPSSARARAQRRHRCRHPDAALRRVQRERHSCGAELHARAFVSKVRSFVTIGRKASDFFKRRTIPIRRQVLVAQAAVDRDRT